MILTVTICEYENVIYYYIGLCIVESSDEDSNVPNTSVHSISDNDMRKVEHKRKERDDDELSVTDNNTKPNLRSLFDFSEEDSNVTNTSVHSLSDNDVEKVEPKRKERDADEQSTTDSNKKRNFRSLFY